ncbi:MAG TPA: TonB-dependent receptor [Puia sp.]|nr:TonB-dependent receptor [Puia sp.]
MSFIKRLLAGGILVLALQPVIAQTIVKGKIIDSLTGQPVAGATIHCTDQGCTCGCTANALGEFTMKCTNHCTSLVVSSIGYSSEEITVAESAGVVLLRPKSIVADEVIISASKGELVKRSEAPIAISVLSKATIEATKATRLDQLLNKVPGVFMVDLGNEQHSMAIRQPLGYSNLYLYLEDGIPIRTVGDFNHNALIEINQASMQRIEVIKGPASSLYGSEAVGGAVNFITQAPSATFSGKVQAEAGSFGYKRTDLTLSNTFGKLGVLLSGYLADQDQNVSQHNDFRKGALTLRTDYALASKSTLSATLDYINYNTDQKGGLDSAHFYRKDYSSFYRFTYRKVDAFRTKIGFQHTWNGQNHTTVTLFYRHSAIGQNPFYSIGNVPGNASKANGQTNVDAFHSYGAIVQHRKSFDWLNAKWISGISVDYSPATYVAHYISIDRDANGIYYQYQSTDSLLTHYAVDLLNTAAYSQFELSATKQLKLTATARYDRLDYHFINFLQPSAYSGAPSTSDYFDHFTPKLGATYDLGKGNGLYANFSVGFAPPNITDLYTGVKVPYLKPASYNNHEVGGWAAFDNKKGYAELCLYRMEGKGEIISVRLPDGSYINQNAGETRHQGIEANLHYTPVQGVTVSLGGTFARHTYVDYVQQGKDYSGKEMSQAPHTIINSEITYRPAFMKGLRLGVEWQSVGKYFTDPANTATYNGFNVLNIRTGYSINGVELWVNCINAGNAIYATTVEKSAYGVSYRPGQLRTFNVGVAYHFRKF